MTAVLPDLDHLLISDYHFVYEPSDDTFLLCDALESDADSFVVRPPLVALEVGSGSGCVITFLAKTLKKLGVKCHCMATDINPSAATTTQRTARHNDVFVDIIRTDLVGSLLPGLCRKVDILIFNPPYVPTPDEEVGGCGIEASWAGGENGRVVIDRFLPLVHELLADGGRCYLVLVEENKPKEIASIMRKQNMIAEIVIKRKAFNEGLQIMRITKPSPTADHEVI